MSDQQLPFLFGLLRLVPLAQPYFLLDVSHVGIEVQYTFIVVSTALSYRF